MTAILGISAFYHDSAAALLIDSPDFNLRLAPKLKASGIPVVYYISPTVWAWRRGRLKAVRESVDRMLLIFPFEQALYERALAIRERARGLDHPEVELHRLLFQTGGSRQG